MNGPTSARRTTSVVGRPPGNEGARSHDNGRNTNCEGVARAGAPCSSVDTTAHALRLVLVIALDRDAVGACLGAGEAVSASLWPSTLYAWAAETAARSPRVFERCATVLDHALAPWMGPYADAPVGRIAEALSTADGAAALAGPEVAAALWSLVRRRERGLEPILERLTREAELLVARACAGGSTARCSTT